MSSRSLPNRPDACHTRQSASRVAMTWLTSAFAIIRILRYFVLNIIHHACFVLDSISLFEVTDLGTNFEQEVAAQTTLTIPLLKDLTAFVVR